MVFDILETDHNARRQNREKVFCEKGCMEVYKENQARRGKKNVNQIMETIRILKAFAYERMTME